MTFRAHNYLRLLAQYEQAAKIDILLFADEIYALCREDTMHFDVY